MDDYNGPSERDFYEGPCQRCDGLGYIEVCYGGNPDNEGRESCPKCDGWQPEEDNPRERDDDDGQTYADPRDEMHDRPGRD